MNLIAFDHIVLCVKDVSASLEFYERVLGMERREERPGKWSIHFGNAKISLQDVDSVPEIAKRTTPGSGNFCLITKESMAKIVNHLEQEGVEIVAGPDEREGATGQMISVYFYDPDKNLVEISRYI